MLRFLFALALMGFAPTIPPLALHANTETPIVVPDTTFAVTIEVDAPPDETPVYVVHTPHDAFTVIATDATTGTFRLAPAPLPEEWLWTGSPPTATLTLTYRVLPGARPGAYTLTYWASAGAHVTQTTQQIYIGQSVYIPAITKE